MESKSVDVSPTISIMEKYDDPNIAIKNRNCQVEFLKSICYL